MAFTPTENGAECRITWQVGSEEFYTVFHIRNTVGWDQTSIDNVAGVIDLDVPAFLLPTMSNQISYTEIRVTDISKLGGSQAIINPVGVVAGTIPIPIAPVAVNVGIKKNTGKVGRAFWGYINHPGVPENEVSGGEIDPLHAANCLIAWNGMRTGLINNNTGMCLRQKVINGVPQDPYKLEFITSFTVPSLKPATTKRRYGKRG